MVPQISARRTPWSPCGVARPTVPYLRLAVSAATDDAVGLLMVRAALSHTLIAIWLRGGRAGRTASRGRRMTA